MELRYTTIACLLLLPFAASAEDLRDPTRPAWLAPASDGSAVWTSLKVSAVFISGERRVAVVNGRRAREGDVVDGSIVRNITRDQVTFERDGKLIDVPLYAGARQ